MHWSYNDLMRLRADLYDEVLTYLVDTKATDVT